MNRKHSRKRTFVRPILWGLLAGAAIYLLMNVPPIGSGAAFSYAFGQDDRAAQLNRYSYGDEGEVHVITDKIYRDGGRHEHSATPGFVEGEIDNDSVMHLNTEGYTASDGTFRSKHTFIVGKDQIQRTIDLPLMPQERIWGTRYIATDNKILYWVDLRNPASVPARIDIAKWSWIESPYMTSIDGSIVVRCQSRTGDPNSESYGLYRWSESDSLVEIANWEVAKQVSSSLQAETHRFAGLIASVSADLKFVELRDPNTGEVTKRIAVPAELQQGKKFHLSERRDFIALLRRSPVSSWYEPRTHGQYLIRRGDDQFSPLPDEVGSVSSLSPDQKHFLANGLGSWLLLDDTGRIIHRFVTEQVYSRFDWINDAEIAIIRSDSVITLDVFDVEQKQIVESYRPFAWVRWCLLATTVLAVACCWDWILDSPKRWNACFAAVVPMLLLMLLLFGRIIWFIDHPMEPGNLEVSLCQALFIALGALIMMWVAMASQSWIRKLLTVIAYMTLLTGFLSVTFHGDPTTSWIGMYTTIIPVLVIGSVFGLLRLLGLRLVETENDAGVQQNSERRQWSTKQLLILISLISVCFAILRAAFSTLPAFFYVPIAWEAIFTGLVGSVALCWMSLSSVRWLRRFSLMVATIIAVLLIHDGYQSWASYVHEPLFLHNDRIVNPGIAAFVVAFAVLGERGIRLRRGVRQQSLETAG